MVVNGLRVTSHAQPSREETLNMKEPPGVLEVVPSCNTQHVWDSMILRKIPKVH